MKPEIEKNADQADDDRAYWERGCWYCPTCDEFVELECVTHEETHDPQCGGCGNPVE